MRVVDLGKPALDRSSARSSDRSLEVFGERIIAAGIEHQNAQILCLLQIGDQVVDPRHAPQIGLVGNLRIDRHQVIDAVVLQRMTAVVEHGDVGFARGAGKANFSVVQTCLVDIDRQDGVEADARERGRDIPGIVARIGQLWRVLIGAVADHQRHAFFRVSGDATSLSPARTQ